MASEKGKYGWKGILGLCFGLFVLMFLICHFPVGHTKLELGPETTVITEPLGEDGLPDYVAALDAIGREGVTPENNAARLMLMALGTDILQHNHETESLKLLGLTPADIAFEHRFVDWLDLLQQTQTPMAIMSGGGGIEDEELDWFVLQQAMRETGDIHPELEKWIEMNKPAMELIAEAASKERFYLPMISTHEKTRPYVDGWSQYRLAESCFELRAEIRMLKGDIPGAWSDRFTIHRLAMLIEQLPTSSAHEMAISIEVSGSEIGRVLAMRSTIGGPEQRRVLAQLQSMKQMGDITGALDVVYRYEIVHDFINLAQNGTVDLLDPNSFNEFAWGDMDWNEVLKVVNRYVDRIKALNMEEAGLARAKALVQLKDEVNQPRTSSISDPLERV